MTKASAKPDSAASWLFAIGEGGNLPFVEGLISVNDFNVEEHSPDTVAVIERAKSYGARAVFFEAQRHGRAPLPQAFIFEADKNQSDESFAQLHKRLWSWGGVPLIYRTSPGLVQLFRCAHQPDFAGSTETPVCNPIRTLRIGMKVAAADVWWDADRLRNGSIWDDTDTCDLMLSAHKSAHRKLVTGVKNLSRTLNDRRLLPPRLRRRLLILSLLIAYLEERSVLLPEDFENVLPNASRFFEVLGNAAALVKLLEALEVRFNGHVFHLDDEDRSALEQSTQLGAYAQLIKGYEDETGQINFWRLYSFRDLPVELISNIYQLFVEDSGSSIYTPPALVRLMLDEVLSWKHIDRLMESDGVILDPACGSGVFLVEAYKRLVLHWRWKNKWQKPDVDVLRSLVLRLRGIDIEEGAVELAAFSLCLSLCDALEPEDIRASIKLFPRLDGETIHLGCFFEIKKQNPIDKPISIIVGNPPFASRLNTDGAKESYDEYNKQNRKLADKQLAYLFMHCAMEMLAPEGYLAMIEPSGFLYNQNALSFRQNFFKRWNVRELLDFVSVRGIFKKGKADTKIVIVVVEAREPSPEDRILHAVFRRSGRAEAEQGYDIDYYDLHWTTNLEAQSSQDQWRGNLLGGNRFKALIERLREYPTIKEYATSNNWDAGEGYFGGQKNASDNIDHLIGKPLLPTDALGGEGINREAITVVPNTGIKDPKTSRRFQPPLLLIKENHDLYMDIWNDGYLVFKNEMVGFSAPGDEKRLRETAEWLKKESVVLQAYVAGISPRLYTQRATSIFNADIFSLPFPKDGNLDLSENERIVAEDAVKYQREFIRIGNESEAMKKVPLNALNDFDSVLTRQVNAIYKQKPLTPRGDFSWAGAICRSYAFGDGEVDWSGAEELREKLSEMLCERRQSGVNISRIVRLYDRNFVFLLKPDRHRFWTRSIALRDADDMLADLRAQGF